MIEPHEALDQAERLLAAGYHLAAAMVCRVALEQHLQALAGQHGVLLRLRGGPTLAVHLCRVGVIDKPTRQTLCKLLRHASKAAHGADLATDRTARLLADARRVLESQRLTLLLAG
jgi:hypothetical protein